jgi:hypothetical protein
MLPTCDVKPRLENILTHPWPKSPALASQWVLSWIIKAINLVLVLFIYIYIYIYTYITLYTVLTSISHVQARPTCSEMLRSLKLGRTYRFRTDIRQISSSGMQWLQQLQHFATLMGAMRLAALENWRATESLGRIDFHSLVPGMTS